MNARSATAPAFAKALRRMIDAAVARSLARFVAMAERPTSALAAALSLATSLPLALLIGVPTAGLGLGLLLGLVVAAGTAFHARALARQHAAAIAAAHADAEHRVLLVTRQYEWAVNDVANLRDALQRARARTSSPAPRPREAAPVARPPQPPSAVRLVRYLRASDPPTTLRFGADGAAPEQVRVVDGRNVVAISARSLEAIGSDATFTIRVSAEIADAFANGARGLAVEALVDDQWYPVVVRAPAAAAAPAPVRDKRGRVWAGVRQEGARL